MIILGNKSNFGVDLSDGCDELVKSNTSISISVSIFNNLIDLSSCEVLSDWSSDSLEIISIKHSFSSWVEDFIYRLKSCLWGGVFIKSKDVKEGSKINISLMSSRLDNREDLWGLILQIKSFNGIDQLFSRDISTSIVVKNIKDFFESMNSFSWKVFGEVFGGIESFLL